MAPRRAVSRNSVSLKGVTDAALRRAILESDDFLQVADEIEGFDLDTTEGRLGALEAALLSGLSIFQRFFANPSCLTTKHPVFAALTLCLSAMPAYLGRAQAADPATGEISELRANWLFHQDQCDKLFRGQLSSMSWFPRPFGALALLNLDASEPFEDCPAGQLYIVETVIEELIPFVRSTMIAAGWAAESKGGYTLHGLFQRQLSYLKWIRKQGELEVDALLPHAQATFLAALLDCDAAHARMLFFGGSYVGENGMLRYQPSVCRRYSSLRTKAKPLGSEIKCGTSTVCSSTSASRSERLPAGATTCSGRGRWPAAG